MDLISDVALYIQYEGPAGHRQLQTSISLMTIFKVPLVFCLVQIKAGCM